MKAAEASSKPLAKASRGSRNKKKKLAKYADQDEHDKKLAQQLLGIQIKEDDDHAEVEAPVSTTTTTTTTASTRPPPKLRKKDSQTRIMEAEKIPQLDEEEQELITPLDILISMPLPEDVLLDAVPTCAPYGALQKFKYKCKLQPGGAKKGKALKAVVAGWCAGAVDETSKDKEKLWPRERELMKGLKDQEVISCVGVKTIKVSGLERRK
jgi:hypothetical protein